jgi:hypothetical protein
VRRHQLSRAEYDRIRAVLNERARARVAAEQGCVGCGANYDTFTAGCYQCSSRRKMRRRRVDPAKLEIDRARWRKNAAVKRARRAQRAA